MLLYKYNLIIIKSSLKKYYVLLEFVFFSYNMINMYKLDYFIYVQFKSWEEFLVMVRRVIYIYIEGFLNFFGFLNIERKQLQKIRK